MATQLQCYNFGCQQNYDPNDNTSTSCTFHPGAPFFHDAYKGWSCCKKKSIDFTEFMNIKGCTKGFHSNEKPVQPKKETEVVETPEPEPVRPILRSQRPDEDTLMVTLTPVVTESLKKLTYNSYCADDKDSESKEVQVGDKCHNNGCDVTYEGPTSDLQECVHHPGVPIFHEGYKYWSCCKKKTTEFEVFQKQKGCAVGKHIWRKPKLEANETVGIVNCRTDWIQTGANITVIIYGKKCDPSKSSVSLNPVKLQAHIFFPEEGGFFKQLWILSGAVDVSNSSVTMTPNKIEITMKKADPLYWSNLEISPEKLEAIRSLKLDSVKSTGVEPVNLNDL